MPSPAHEVVVFALGERPQVLAVLVQKLLGRTLPLPLAKVDSTVRFADPEEIRPDIVLDTEGGGWVLVEVQHEDDDDKGRRWLLAAAVLNDRTRTMGDVVVIAFRPSVARWARRVAQVRGPLGTLSTLRPVVLLLAGPALDSLLDDA